jgi:quercetin dioxygenase-like cupin family protein
MTGLFASTWNDLELEEVLPGITRQMLHGERQTLVRYAYAPGSVFPVHSHEQEQITTVLSGTITFTIDGDRLDLGPGGVAVIPGGTPHGAEVSGTDPVETLNALSPARLAGPKVESMEQAG